MTVFCTQALRTSLLELAPRFEKATGHKVNLIVAPLRPAGDRKSRPARSPIF